MINFSYLFLLAVTLIVLSVVYFLWRHRHGFESLDLAVFQVKIQKNGDDKKEGEVKNRDAMSDINLSEQLFNSLSSIGRPFVFEVAVDNRTEEIRFYVCVPREQLAFAKRQIQGLFLDATVEDALDYTVFNEHDDTAAAYLKLKEIYILPLRTYKESETDTFATIVSTLTKLGDKGEGAALQFICRPGTGLNKKNLSSVIDSLRKGSKLWDILHPGKAVLKEFTKSLDPMANYSGSDDKPKPIDEDALKAIQQKASKPLFNVNVRLIASSNVPGQAEEVLRAITGAFAQFTSVLRNNFEVMRDKQKKTIYQYIFREYNEAQTMVLNSEELASIFHIPTLTTDVPRIAWLRTKEIAPPADLPVGGTIIGESQFRGDKRLVRLTEADRLRHIYAVGQTGTGKSYFLFTPMVVQDMDDGKGVCVIDPHGELIDTILERVPRHRVNDVIVFDPGDLSRPMGINMLEYNLDKPEEKSFIVNELIGIFGKLYDLKTTGGPMFEYYLRNALLLLMADAKNDPPTMLDVPRVFTDPAYRNMKLARINDQMVIDFWQKEAAKATGETGLQNMGPYITSKFSSFISNDYMRPIIGQAKSAFNFRQVMDEGKILLVKLSKGKIGEMNANLLGMIFTGRILMAALSRGDIAPSERRNFYFYIDEFQNFTTDSISQILSESRKYGLSLTIAHQFIAQLQDNIREAVFGNVGSLVAFRVGDGDTERLVKVFGPEFSAKDLISTDNSKALVRLLINGMPSRPFNIQCLPPRDGNTEIRKKMEELSKLTYGRPLAEVETEIIRKLKDNSIGIIPTSVPELVK